MTDDEKSIIVIFDNFKGIGAIDADTGILISLFKVQPNDGSH